MYVDSYNREVYELEENVKFCHMKAVQSKKQNNKYMALYYLKKKKLLEKNAEQYQNMSMLLMDRKDQIVNLKENREFAKVLKETNDLLNNHLND